MSIAKSLIRTAHKMIRSQHRPKQDKRTGNLRCKIDHQAWPCTVECSIRDAEANGLV